LYLRRIAGHHNHHPHSQSSRSISHSLRVIAAGVRNHPARAFFHAERRNLVVCAPQLERPHRLQVLRLEKDLPLVRQLATHQRSPHCYAAQQLTRGLDILQRYHAFCLRSYHLHFTVLGFSGLTLSRPAARWRKNPPAPIFLSKALRCPHPHGSTPCLLSRLSGPVLVHHVP